MLDGFGNIKILADIGEYWGNLGLYNRPQGRCMTLISSYRTKLCVQINQFDEICANSNTYRMHDSQISDLNPEEHIQYLRNICTGMTNDVNPENLSHKNFGKLSQCR
ncbi:hypothetical protein CEXT_414961 [Caerostris extrusa]|uniref:Uncharacterized protein n=1 Tax=Caerostris extrusa TaxID=172846 RepID=A0AAV4MN44_CAEEX|nr:hypothetical protein CEXT_414961 [Caerostris extrusa]